MSILNRAEMFNRKANNIKSKSNEVIRSLKIKKGYVICDIGSGGGYYTMRFAAEVGLDGKVYAIDTNKAFLSYIGNQITENELTNVETMLVDKKVKELPIGGCDLIFLRNVYHHIENPEEYFREIQQFLKPNGRIVIIDYKKSNKFSFINLMHHFVKEEDIISIMSKAGFKQVETFDYLPNQSFNIFQVKGYSHLY